MESGIRDDGYSVEAACKDYVDDRRSEKNEACAHDADKRFERTVYGTAFGKMPCARVLSLDIKKWRQETGLSKSSQNICGSSLAPCVRCWHYASMAIQISIRGVPEKVRDELAARAALQGKSMQEFLRAELERLAARPSVDAWLQQVRKRKRAARTRVSSKQILENRDADRR